MPFLEFPISIIILAISILPQTRFQSTFSVSENYSEFICHNCLFSSSIRNTSLLVRLGSECCFFLEVTFFCIYSFLLHLLEWTFILVHFMVNYKQKIYLHHSYGSWYRHLVRACILYSKLPKGQGALLRQKEKNQLNSFFLSGTHSCEN
jgi:hypothetical protein